MNQSQSIYWKIFLLAFVVSMVGIFVWQKQYPTATVLLKDERLHVLVANTPARHYRGLGKRDTLLPYDGMLFLFSDPERYAFVMRDMKFSIDIVWLHNGAVVDVAPSVPLDDASELELRRYTPRAPANVVLELPAGWAESHHLAIGNRLTVVDE